MKFNDDLRGLAPHRLNAKQLRDMQSLQDVPRPQTARNPMYFILDNVYDTYNIGGLFRLADALNISKLYICGESETPPNHRIKKASIGTYKVIPWEYKATTVQAIQDLRAEFSDDSDNQDLRAEFSDSNDKVDDGASLQVIAIEQDLRARPYTTFDYSRPVAFVLGNETRGCSAEVLDACDAIVEMPMYGLNTSLNVIVSAAIVAYHVAGQAPHPHLTTNPKKAYK